MIQSYTQNPSFGDATTFQEELDSSILKVQTLEAKLHSLNIVLKEIDYQLEQRKSSQKTSHPTPSLSPKLESASPEGSRASSAGYGTISSVGSSDSDIVCALYDYAGKCGDSSIAMVAGELFTRTEGDEAGWTKVRRINSNKGGSEGFVPTSYLTLVKTDL